MASSPSSNLDQQLDVAKTPTAIVPVVPELGWLMVEIRGVREESERLQWEMSPLVSVGPLVFGMTHEEVAFAAESAVVPLYAEHSHPGFVHRAVFVYHDRKPLDRPAFVTYYDESGRLACVAVDAGGGPQINLDGLKLVGRVPSDLERQFGGYLGARDEGIRVSEYGDPSSLALGIVLRVQRCGDVVLSRPVLVTRDWAGRAADASEGPVPRTEWLTFQ